MKIGSNNITSNIRCEIVNQYYHSPHNGLSNYAWFDVSRGRVQKDEELEKYIKSLVRKVIMKLLINLDIDCMKYLIY